MSSHHHPEDQQRADHSENLTRRGHELVEVLERVPGREPTDAPVELTEGPPYEYTTRFWRCRNCGQERNRRAEFHERCEVDEVPTPLSDGGYSIQDARTRRALTEDMDVRFGERGPAYEVHSQSGNTYVVDIEAGTCTCPDHARRGDRLAPRGGCKHRRRVDLEIRAGQTPQPDGTFRSRLDGSKARGTAD